MYPNPHLVRSGHNGFFSKTTLLISLDSEKMLFLMVKSKPSTLITEPALPNHKNSSLTNAYQKETLATARTKNNQVCI